MKILLLEDDKMLSLTIKDMLENYDFIVEVAYTMQDAIDKTFKYTYDAYVFDVNLPDGDGINLLQSLKESGDKTPVLLISADIDISTISRGFEIGADDYIKKPFSPEELMIRLNAKLSSKFIITHKNIVYNSVSQDISVNGKTIYLSYVQFNIFKLLFNSIGVVILKDILLDVLENQSDNALRVAISKLKHTLGIDIKNVRGVGYIIDKD